ncbi:arylsulfatase (plasmid) [Catenovulum sp. SX2]|uniref:arylsulfatase n=1 Tax=Catenovulum sp. SX2 TaxID=3398614 RepID=UPI003F8374D4
MFYKVLIILSVCLSAHTVDCFAQNKPNLVVIMADDLGWGDISLNGNKQVQTPNIDSIANNGAQFDTFLVSPVCSPSRAALLTGRHALKTGVYSVTRGGDKMRTSEVTLAEMLKQQGYATGAFGKWHNGAHYPHNANGQGFDDFVGFSDGHQTLYFDPVLEHNQNKIKTNGYIADVTSDYAIDFIKQNQHQPFFAFLPINTPHSPFELPQQLFAKYKQQGLSDLDASIYGMVENIDDNVGKVLTTLKKLKLIDNTIVVFMSDNGPAFPHGNKRFNGNLKGHKGKVDLGGILSPLHLQYPAKLAGKTKVVQPIQHIDLVPTLLDLMSLQPTEKIDFDGISMAGDMLKPTAEIVPRLLYTHHFRNTQRRNQQAILPNPASVLYYPWFAVFETDQTWRLFNIADDKIQSLDVAATHKNQLDKMRSAYMDWYLEASRDLAEIPTHIGHAKHNKVELAAHEGHISGLGIDYANKAGWAHDSINVTEPQHAIIDFPLKVVAAGRYQMRLRYNSEQQVEENSIQLRIHHQNCLVKTLAATKPNVQLGQRLYYTDEAVEQSWGYSEPCEFELPPTTDKLLIQFKKSPKTPLAIKAVEITQIL